MRPSTFVLIDMGEARNRSQNMAAHANSGRAPEVGWEGVADTCTYMLPSSNVGTHVIGPSQPQLANPLFEHGCREGSPKL